MSLPVSFCYRVSFSQQRLNKSPHISLRHFEIAMTTFPIVPVLWSGWEDPALCGMPAGWAADSVHMATQLRGVAATRTCACKVPEQSEKKNGWLMLTSDYVQFIFETGWGSTSTVYIYLLQRASCEAGAGIWIVSNWRVCAVRSWSRPLSDSWRNL